MLKVSLLSVAILAGCGIKKTQSTPAEVLPEPKIVAPQVPQERKPLTQRPPKGLSKHLQRVMDLHRTKPDPKPEPRDDK